MQHQANQQFLTSPAGRARTARQTGAKTFQLVLSLSNSMAHKSGSTTLTRHEDHAWYIDSVEHEGWSLLSSDFVFRPTREVTSINTGIAGVGGSSTGIEGEIVSIYMFRVVQ